MFPALSFLVAAAAARAWLAAGLSARCHCLEAPPTGQNPARHIVWHKVLQLPTQLALTCRSPRVPICLQFLRQQHLADVTEIFRQAGPRKRRDMLKLVFYLLTFILAIYK